MSEKETPKDKKQKHHVVMIEDPFGIKTNEIADAQNSSEELILDRDLEIEYHALDQTQLDNIAAAISENQTEFAEAKAENAEEEANRAAAELAAQIAEDQALERELAAQAEAEALVDPELLAALPLAREDGTLDLSEVQSCLEALLFMSDKPISIAKLQEFLGPDFGKEIFEKAILELQKRYQATHFGVEVVAVAGGYQMRTKPGRAALARKLAKVQTQRLSSGAMETLAITAYRQPVLKDEIDKIRGVDSSYFIRGLLDKKLIKITGRSELPGKPMLYATSTEFLELFGLNDLAALPSLREIEQMVPSSQSANPLDEDPRVKQMRKLVGEMKADTSTTLNYDPREDEKILKEIRERVNAIPTSTPYLDEQKALEKAIASGDHSALAAFEGRTAESSAKTPAPELDFAPPPEAEELQSSEANPEQG